MGAAPRRTGRVLLSWALFAASIALFAAVAYVYWEDRNDEEQIPTPPSNPGRNEMINVKQALEAQDLEVEFLRTGGARSDDLTPAGQGLTVDDATLYVFIYPEGPVAREEETEELQEQNPASLTLLDNRRTPIPGGPPRVFMGSNVVAALVGGDDELAGKVQAAIEGLP
jgi:hypothetical protein